MIHYRKATINDVDIIFNWSNDGRQFSFNSEPIAYENHVKWFNAKLLDDSSFFYIFSNTQNENIGLVRIENKEDETIIGILIDKNHRGKSYSSEMLLQATSAFFKIFPQKSIQAYIKNNNIASIKSFTKAGFINPQNSIINNIPSVILSKKLK